MYSRWHGTVWATHEIRLLDYVPVKRPTDLA